MPSSFEIETETEMPLVWDEMPVDAEDGYAPKIRSINDLPSVSEMPVEEIDFAVKGFLAYGTVNMFSSEPGGGKTSLAMKLCHCISAGMPFAGLPVKLGHALYIDYEQSKPVIQEKYQRLNIHDGNRFKYWGHWAGTPPALNSPILSEYVAGCDPKPLIVVDPFIGAHPGDENSSSETRQFMGQARFLANLGACVLLLHHTGKADSAKNYRGSSDIPAGLDAAWLVSNLGDGGRLGKLRLTAYKARISVTLDSIIEYRDGEFIGDSRLNAVSKTVSEQLGELLKRNPGVTVRAFEELAGKHGLGHHRARQFLSDGIQTGTVRQEKGERNSRLHYLNEDFHE